MNDYRVQAISGYENAQIENADSLAVQMSFVPNGNFDQAQMNQLVLAAASNGNRIRCSRIGPKMALKLSLAVAKMKSVRSIPITG